MKSLKYIPLVLVLSLLIGCATTFRPWKLSEVQEGMSRSDVIEILGQPDSVNTEDGVELLYYSYSEDFSPAPADNELRFDGATDPFKEKALGNNFKEYKYVVKLADGKVLNYEELEDEI